MQFLTVLPADVWCWGVHPTNSSAPETEVDLQSDDVGRRSVPASSGSIRDQQHPAVVVPGGIQLRNSFEALGRNDEDDAPIDGNEVFFGDESETESLPDSDQGHVEPVEEFIPVEDPDLSTSVWRLWTELI